MNDFAIQAEHVGKRYFLGETSGRNYLGQAIKSIMPSAKIGNFQEFWAVRDVNFTINKGEAVGVIGRNGAGKSTLLKMLSRVSAPTEGRIRVRGRVGTLLEVGTGFHPELTGRDNIFLSGTILGMGYREVARKFDEIVAFSEIEKFIDTPVKRYSSGMYVRLAFAVASFLEPEILIVDEVLAVGDASFQRKSLGRLNEVSERDGRTVLFVSHNLSAIRTFCKRVLVLEKGQLVFDGPAQEGIEHYFGATSTKIDVHGVGMRDRLNRANGAVRFVDVSAQDAQGKEKWKFKQGEDIHMRFGYHVVSSVPNMTFIIEFRAAMDDQLISTIREVITDLPLETNSRGVIELILPRTMLRPNELSIRANLFRTDHAIGYDIIDINVGLPYLVIASDSEEKYTRLGLVSLDYRLNHVRNEEGGEISLPASSGE
jgi:lipopolysaccharide transport system ATP-binding protein